MGKLENRVSIITGSSRGIGRAIALKFAEEGSDIVVTYHTREDKASEVAKIIRDTGRKVLITQVDVSRREDVKKMVKKTIDEFGRIDVLVNNAGINKPNDFDKITDEEWDRILSVNLKGAFICMQEVLPYIQRKSSENKGKIINISSVSGQYGGPRTTHYAVSKAGLISLTQNGAIFFAKYNVCVNAIAPGLIHSEMAQSALSQGLGKKLLEKILLGHLGSVEDIASAAVFLASSDSDYITGQVINVNGGLYLG